MGRFTDLVNGLPGIGTNLLAARLKEMEEAGLLDHRTLPPPSASSVYSLTELGGGLRPVIDELWNWGSKTMQGPREGDRFRPGWAVLAMQYVFNPDVARGVKETYEFRIGDDVFFAQIEDGAITTGQGFAASPDLIITTNPDTFFELASGNISLLNAVDSGVAQFEGERESVERCERMFSVAEV